MSIIFHDTYPACNGDCAQGRKPCPTPAACSVPMDDGMNLGAFAWPGIVALVIVIGLVGFMVFA